MIKSIVFKAKLDNVNIIGGPEEVKALLERVHAAIASVSGDVLIDPRVEVQEVQPEIQRTTHGAAAIDGYMEVKKADGRVVCYYNCNGKSYEISKEEYDRIHSTPEMQAQLASARRAAGIEQGTEQ